MSRAVRPSTQVIEFARRLAPGPRRAVKHALAELREERGDICALEGNLAGYYRLRVGRYRIIFNYAANGTIAAIFLEERQLVYEVFEAQFIKRLKSGSSLFSMSRGTPGKARNSVQSRQGHH